MASKTKVNGTNYSIKGGKCRVNGTNYSIKKGRTLEDGTGYDVSFGPSAIPVTITGTGNSTNCFASINGTKYISATSGIEVMPGDVITFSVHGYDSSNYGEVRINGVQVLKASNVQIKTYSWTVPDGTSTISIVLNKQSSYSSITVTTT